MSSKYSYSSWYYSSQGEGAGHWLLLAAAGWLHGCWGAACWVRVRPPPPAGFLCATAYCLPVAKKGGEGPYGGLDKCHSASRRLWRQ
jgi:hypothetical protein|eukprot:COSAG01_NODE_242_length_20582_cov_314.397256_9_plen_87_part_00